MKNNESELIQRLIDGEENAFREVVGAHQANMLYVARSIIGDAIADEVVQESWVSILKALPKFEGRSSLKTWILRIVTNAALTRLRKESRLVQFGELEDLESGKLSSDRFKPNAHWSTPPTVWEQGSPDAILQSEQLKEKLWQAISLLSPVQRTIINMRDMQGMDMQEICKVLEITESNSRVLLHRARVQLWQVIEKFNQD